MHEDIPILNFLVPKEFTHDNGRLTGVTVREGRRPSTTTRAAARSCPPASPTSTSSATTCWSRSARRTPSPGSSATSASSSTSGTCPRSIRRPCGSTNPKVFFGGDAAFGPKNIIWAVAHGHEAAVSIDKLLNGEDIDDRARCRPSTSSARRWASTSGATTTTSPTTSASACRCATRSMALADIKAEVELGFDTQLALKEAERCLNCDIQTVFTAVAVHRVRRLRRHLPDGLHHLHRRTATEADLRTRLQAPALNLTQDIYVADGLKTGRIMAKDEDVCLHCGLCAERCPTGAWDMQKFLLDMTHAGHDMPRTKPDLQRKRLRRQVRQRQRLGLGERQRAVRQGDPAHGRAGGGAQHLPLQHPGPADLVRGAHLARPAISAPAAAST